MVADETNASGHKNGCHAGPVRIKIARRRQGERISQGLDSIQGRIIGPARCQGSANHRANRGDRSES